MFIILSAPDAESDLGRSLNELAMRYRQSGVHVAIFRRKGLLGVRNIEVHIPASRIWG